MEIIYPIHKLRVSFLHTKGLYHKGQSGLCLLSLRALVLMTQSLIVSSKVTFNLPSEQDLGSLHTTLLVAALIAQCLMAHVHISIDCDMQFMPPQVRPIVLKKSSSLSKDSLLSAMSLRHGFH